MPDRPAKTDAALDVLFERLDFSVRTLAVCRVTAGWELTFPAAPRPTLFHVVDGAGKIDGSRAEFLVGRHSFVLIPAERTHRALVPPVATRPVGMGDAGAGLAAGLLVIEAGAAPWGLTAVCGEVDARAAGVVVLLTAQSEALHGDLSDAPQITGLYEAVMAEIPAPGPGLQALVGTLLKQSLILTLRRKAQMGHLTPSFAAAVCDPALTRAVTAMLLDPRREHTLASLAREAQVSRSVLAARFKEAFGQGPIGVLRELRLTTAARLLRAEGRSVKEAAHAVGYASRSHFSHAFAERFGVRPSDWADEQGANTPG